MKKQIIIIGITLLLLAVGLSGCTSEQEGAKIETGDENQLNGDQSVEGKIAYVSDGNIHIINPDGTNEIRLTEGVMPVWSPDGKKISYSIVPYRGDNWNAQQDETEIGIYVINADGTGKTRITELAPHSWLSDGERILFIITAGRLNEEIEPGIYIVNADGSNLVKIAEIEIEGTILSIDEKKIIYENPEDNTVYIMNFDGTDTTTLIEDTNVYQLTMSPDGKKITYVTSEKDGTIYKVDADGKNKIMLVTSDAVAPVWSPDSKKIAYLRNKHDYVASLCIMNPDGTGKKEIVEGWIEYDSRQSWSPDGKKIVFTMDDPSNIYIVNVDGSGLTQRAIGFYPQWSPS